MPAADAYYNDRNDRISVVEYRGNTVTRSTLEPRVRLFPKQGESFPDRIEFRRRGQQFAVFTLGDYKRARDPNLPFVLVVSQSGVAVASRALLDKLDREWNPAHYLSHPVSFSGGDGSSMDKAIIVHAKADGDEGAAHETYIREHFGYAWTYKSIKFGVRFTQNRIYDVYEFVTRDGRKHVLYFDTTKARAGMVKRI